MKVLVAGANGSTGKLILEELAGEGMAPVALARDAEQANELEGYDVRIGDLETLGAEVFEGIGAAIFAAGSGGSTGADKTILVDQEGAKRFADLAAEAGLNRIVVLSAKGADAPEDTEKDIQPYMYAKRAADDHIAALSIPSTIVRPVKLSHSDGSGRVELSQSVVFEGEIPRADVAKVLVAALADTSDANHILELKSGDTPIAEAIERTRGRTLVP